METIVRAIEMPLQHLDGDWELLRECWRQSSGLARWCVQTLLRHEPVLLPGEKTLPVFPKLKGRRLKGLYGIASEEIGFTRPGSWWKGACSSASTICRNVERKYHKERRQAILHGTRNVAYYERRDYPWPVHADAWKTAWLDESGKPCIQVTLPGGTLMLRLRGGPEFARQMAVFRQIVKGDIPRLEIQIRQQLSSSSCHRPTMQMREPGGGQRTEQRVMIKMVARLPVRRSESDKILHLYTHESALWVAECEGHEVWRLNADHLKRMTDWKNLYDARRQRWSEDCKAERRSDPQKRRQFEDHRERAAIKHKRRMKSWIQETVSHLARFAVRQKVGIVYYDDRVRTFLPGFQWAALRSQLEAKLTEAGIGLPPAQEQRSA